MPVAATAPMATWLPEFGGTACAIRVRGHDSLAGPIFLERTLDSLRARGWTPAAGMEACGPDGSVLRLDQGAVACALFGQWDGGDDGGVVKRRADTFTVGLACVPLAAPADRR